MTCLSTAEYHPDDETNTQLSHPCPNLLSCVQAFWREMKRQLLQALLMCLVMVIIFWVMGYPLPWLSGSRPPQDSVPSPVEDIYEQPSAHARQANLPVDR